MKLSDLIAQLEAEKAKHGDIEVLIADRNYDLYDVGWIHRNDNGADYPPDWNIPSSYLALVVLN